MRLSVLSARPAAVYLRLMRESMNILHLVEMRIFIIIASVLIARRTLMR